MYNQGMMKSQDTPITDLYVKHLRKNYKLAFDESSDSGSDSSRSSHASPIGYSQSDIYSPAAVLTKKQEAAATRTNPSIAKQLLFQLQTNADDGNPYYNSMTALVSIFI